MSYGLKYYNEFKDYFDRDVRINFSYLDFAGTATELKSSIDAATIYQPESENNLFSAIRGSELRINLLSESNFQLIDLFIINNRQVKVEVTIDSVTKWVGWLTPNSYNEPYTAAPYFITVTALDGLGQLKTIDWEFEGFTSPLLILFEILSKTDLSLDLWEAVNIYEDFMDSDVTDSMLNQCYYNCQNYKGMNYYDVLEDLLTGLGAEIQQINGAWKIVRVIETKNALVKRRIDLNLSGDGTSQETEILTKLIGRSENRNFANYDAEILGLPGWNRAKFERDAGRKYGFDNSNFGATFEDVKYVYTNQTIEKRKVLSVSNKRDPYIDTSGGQLAKYWNASAGTVVKKYNKDKNWKQRILTFNTSSNSFDYSLSQLIFGGESTSILDIAKNQELTFKVSMAFAKSELYPDDVVTVGANIILTISNGVNTYYLNSDGNWYNTQQLIQYKDVFCETLSKISFKQISISTTNVPIDGNISVYIYAPYTMNGQNYDKLDSWFIEECSIDTVNQFWGMYLENGTTETPELNGFQYFNNNMSFTPDFDIKFKFGDYPEINNRMLVYQNGIIKALLGTEAYKPTESWKQRGSTVKSDLFTNLLSSYQEIYNQNRWVIRGTILSQDLQFDSTIVDYNVSSRKYYCKGGTYDLQRVQFSGVFHEVGSWEDSDWILKNGTWDDNGIWVDGDTWNDSEPI